jgi:hypothetical protein
MTPAERTMTPLERAEKLLDFYRLRGDYTGDESALIVDALADILHYAWEVDVDFNDCVDQAVHIGRSERSKLL